VEDLFASLQAQVHLVVTSLLLEARVLFPLVDLWVSLEALEKLLVEV